MRMILNNSLTTDFNKCIGEGPSTSIASDRYWLPLPLLPRPNLPEFETEYGVKLMYLCRSWVINGSGWLLSSLHFY